MSTLRFGLLGLGIHGRRYARHLLAGDAPGVELAGFWTRSDATAESVLGDHPDLRRHSPEALIEADELDAVIFALPLGVAAPLLERALRSGRTVLAEKPLAVTVVDAERLLAAGGRLSVAHTLRFDPLLEALRAEVASGVLGSPRGFAFHQRLEPRPVAWEKARELARGGVVAQTGVHALDAVRFVLGEPELTVEHASLRHVHGHETEDQAELVVSASPSEAEVLGSISVSKVGGSRHHRYAVLLDEGGVEADFIDRMLWVTRGRQRRAMPYPERPTLKPLLGAFAAYVRGEAANPVPGTLGLATAKAIEEAYRWSGPRA